MSLILETKQDIAKIADELEACKSVLQLETWYKKNLAGKTVDMITMRILQDMFSRRYKALQGDKNARWVSGPRISSLVTSESRSTDNGDKRNE